MSDELEIQPTVSATKRKDKIKALIEADKAAVKATMGTTEGRRTVWRILETTGYFQISFTGNSETYFREGKRLIGKLLYDELNAVCPDLYIQMMSENRKEASNG